MNIHKFIIKHSLKNKDEKWHMQMENQNQSLQKSIL